MAGPFNYMETARRFNDTADLTNLQRKGCLLELALHVSLAKVAQVAALPRAATIALGHSKIAKTALATFDLLLVTANDAVRVLLCAVNLLLTPRGGAAAALVLHKQVGGANLAIRYRTISRTRGRC